LTGGGPIYNGERTTRDALTGFDRALNDKLKPKVRNVFISFHTEDEAQVDLLRYQKDNDFGLDFRDYSIKEPFDNAWKTNCKLKMELCSATIVMIGPDTADRDAVNWEIDQALKLGHKVIGVKIYRDADHPVPKALKDNDCKILYWNVAQISKELDT
jgi:hypothetical protein